VAGGRRSIPTRSFAPTSKEGTRTPTLPELQGVGIMTDGDQTRTSSMADYAGIVLYKRERGVAAVHCLPGGSADADAAADPGARLSSTVISGAIAVIIRRTSRALLPAAKHTTSHRRHGEHDRK
jgi:hypothetical protein